MSTPPRPFGEVDAEVEMHLEFTRDWYAVRFEALKAWAKTNKHPEVFAILANGAEDGAPPTYAQILNITRHERDDAKRKLAASEASMNLLVAQLRVCVAAMQKNIEFAAVKDEQVLALGIEGTRDLLRSLGLECP